MAQKMGVNPNTVQRAFAELERDGLMYTERTAGRFITNDINRINTVKEESAIRTIAEFVMSMRKSGFEDSQILKLVQNYLEGDGKNG